MKKTALLVALWWTASTIAGVAAPAYAGDDEAEGRKRFKQGQEFYLQGKYLEAAQEFEVGYEAAPRPLFLYNIGNSYRRAGEFLKAKQAYENLLRLAPDVPQRAEVENNIKSIDDALAAASVDVLAAPAPPPNQDPGSSAASDLAALDFSPTESEARATSRRASALLKARPAQAPDSVFTTPWFWVTAVTVVAGGVAAAILLTRSPAATCPGQICLTEPPR